MRRTYIVAILTATTMALSLSACGEKTKTQETRQEDLSSKTSTEVTQYVLEQSPKSDLIQTTATAPASAYPDEYQDYVGRWINTESSRCSMEIRSNGNGTYAIEITWSDSAVAYYKWTMTGRPSQKRRGGGLDYTDGVRSLVTFLDENTSNSKEEVTGETGNFFVNESGSMYWTDPSENNGEAVEFTYDDGNFDPAIAGNDYIVNGSDNHKLTEAEVSGLTKDELRLARNEIYARHGLMFQAQDLQEYFGRQYWYNPSIPSGQFDENILNSYEKENLQLLKRLENRK